MNGCTRRSLLRFGACAVVMGGGGFPVRVLATPDEATKVVNSFTDGVQTQAGRITLEMPEIAENGGAVPLSVSVDSPMTPDDYVESLLIVAEGNPYPDVATFHFSPMSGTAEASTRIRLARTQGVIAVAKMKDGSFYTARADIKVSIGGCGG